MGRLGLPFKIPFGSDAALQTADVLWAASTPTLQHSPAEAPVPVRREAVTPLAALQREARFVDFIQESIDAYNDAQMGVAVRDVDRGCQEVPERMVDLKPVVDQEEETSVQITDPAAAGWCLTGNIGQLLSSVSGKLMHAGWTPSRCPRSGTS